MITFDKNSQQSVHFNEWR